MATIKITGLPAAATVAAADILPIAHDPSGSPITQKATALQSRAVSPDPLIFSGLQLNSTQPLNTTHGFGARPSYHQMRVVFIVAIGGYSIGDEIDFRAVNSTSGDYIISYGVNATSVWVSLQGPMSGWPNVSIVSKAGGSVFQADGTQLAGKVYLWK